MDRAEGFPTFCDLVKQVQETWAQPRNRNISETDTRERFILPICDLLGYHSLDERVAEYPIKATGKRLDYLLLVNGKKTLAIEAKSFGAELSHGDAGQLIEYASVEGVEWGIVTNGRQLWVYQVFVPADIDVRLVLEIDLLALKATKDQRQAFDQLWLLSKEQVLTPDGARKLVRDKQLEKAITQSILNPRSNVVKALSRDVKDLTQSAIIPGGEEVVNWLRTKLQEAARSEPEESAQPEQLGVQPTTEAKGYTPFIKALMDNETLTDGDVLVSEHNGQHYEARVGKDASLTWEGRKAYRPGVVAKWITGAPTDGMEFWKFKGKTLSQLLWGT